MSDLSILRTVTPIGMMEVDLSKIQIVNLIEITHGGQCKTMYPNKIIYPCVIKDLMGDKGRQIDGWTMSPTMHEDLLVNIKHASNILLADDKWEAYPIRGGQMIILHHKRKG